MGGLVSTVSEYFYGAPNSTPYQQHYSYPQTSQTSSYIYPTVQTQSSRPSTTTNNRHEGSHRRSSGLSYSRALATNLSQNRSSYNVAPQRTVIYNSNQFYTYTTEQCARECDWVTFSDEVRIVQLINTRTYFNIKQDFSKYIKRENPTVIKILQVRNNVLMGQYLLKKAEYQSKGIKFQEKLYYHGTKEANVNNICRNNFNWRITKRNLFGHGVSFAPKSSYAINYCDKGQHRTYVMFVAKVLVGETCVGSKNLPLPHNGFDATAKEDGNVIVKFYDNEFYPEYIIYFTADLTPRYNNQQHMYYRE